MAKKGSITVFLTLMLSLILSLVCTSIESVRMAAARTQILCGMDIGLYSLFGQFDKTALKDYDLFLVDGSCGGGNLKLEKIYENMESYMEPILRQNSQKLSIEQGKVTGYHLITDENGEYFFQQIVQYMKDTLGSQGIQLLIERIQNRSAQTEQARQRGIEMKNGTTLDSYDSEMNSAAQNSKELEKKKKEEAKAQGKKPETAVSVPKKNVVNPISTIKRIMKMGILELVLPPGKTVSSAQANKKNMLSGRRLQRGLGMSSKIRKDSSYTSQLLYQEYLMQKLGNFFKPADFGLTYQIEYILCGKKTDRENLRSIADQLLLIREGVNIASLMADPVKRAGITSLSAAIAATFLVPPAAGIIETAIILCWAFAESILDVRELLDGGRVPLTKTEGQWQLSLDKLPYLMSNLDSVRKNDVNGLSYEDYLRILLLAKNKTDKVKRGMDMIELAIREKKQNENFKMDSGIVELEASVDVKANKRKTFNVKKQYSYD